MSIGIHEATELSVYICEWNEQVIDIEIDPTSSRVAHNNNTKERVKRDSKKAY